MRNIFVILTAAVLMAGAVFAQEKSESVAGILKELETYQPSAAEAPAVAAPKTEEKSGWFGFGKKDNDAEQAAEALDDTPVGLMGDDSAPTDLDLDSAMDESRELYVAGEFEAAQKGFEEIVKRDPENIFARMYLRKLIERDERIVEVEGMKAVTASWKTDLVNRSYILSDSAIEDMGLAEAETAVDVAVRFPEIDYPKGSAAIYQPKQGKIFVRNTRANLEVLEEILDAMDISKHTEDVEQVEIEAKFVEVSEGTLEELGFEWRSDAQTEYTLGDDVTFPGGQYLFEKTLRGGPSGPDMPFSRPNDLGDGSQSAYGDWTAFRFEDTFNKDPGYLELQHTGSDPFTLLISALDQTTGTDVLSAPRVVVKSGEEAIIRVGQLHYFPEVFEVGAAEGNILHVSYQDFEERLLGVELEVTPKVDGGQIELGLNPRIHELIGWQNYDIAPADSAYTYYQYRLGFVFKHDPLVASLPIFKKREIETEVTIADGSTIGMGGLISEKNEAFEDKVPVLGHLPLLGRLFRNEGERVIKRNLLMFVTARKVAPSGRIVTDRIFE